MVVDRPPGKNDFSHVPTEMRLNIYQEVCRSGALQDFDKLARVSKDIRREAFDLVSQSCRRDLKHWLETDFGFLICCVLYHGDPSDDTHFNPDRKNTTLDDIVAHAICSFEDEPLRFHFPFSSIVHVRVLRKIIHAIRKSVNSVVSISGQVDKCRHVMERPQTHRYPTIIVSSISDQKFKQQYLCKYSYLRAFYLRPATSHAKGVDPLSALSDMSQRFTVNNQSYKILHVVVDVEAADVDTAHVETAHVETAHVGTVGAETADVGTTQQDSFHVVRNLQLAAGLRCNCSLSGLSQILCKSSHHADASLLGFDYTEAPQTTKVITESLRSKFTHLKTVQLRLSGPERASVTENVKLIKEIFAELNQVTTLILNMRLAGPIDLSALLHFRTLQMVEDVPETADTVITLPTSLQKFSLKTRIANASALIRILPNINKLKKLEDFDVALDRWSFSPFSTADIVTCRMSKFCISVLANYDFKALKGEFDSVRFGTQVFLTDLPTTTEQASSILKTKHMTLTVSALPLLRFAANLRSLDLLGFKAGGLQQYGHLASLEHLEDLTMFPGLLPAEALPKVRAHHSIGEVFPSSLQRLTLRGRSSSIRGQCWAFSKLIHLRELGFPDLPIEYDEWDLPASLLVLEFQEAEDPVVMEKVWTGVASKHRHAIVRMLPHISDDQYIHHFWPRTSLRTYHDEFITKHWTPKKQSSTIHSSESHTTLTAAHVGGSRHHKSAS